MSAQTDFRQILQGGEQANQAVVWDWMTGNSAEIVGRVAPSGQTWGVGSGGTNNVEVTSSTMRLQAGAAAETSYPYLQSSTAVTVIGSEIEFVAAGGATHYAAATMIIAENANDLADSPFLHFTVSSFGTITLDWFAAGLNGGTTATTNLSGTFNLSQTYSMTAMVEANGTVTFLSPLGKLQLTGLTIPPMTYGIWEFSANGADLRTTLYYRKVWLNPVFANIMGQTTQPYSGILEKIAGGRATTLNAVTLTAAGNITLAAGNAVRVPVHSAFANGGISFTNAAGTAQAMIFGLGADNQGFWNLPSGGDMHLYNNAGNILLYRWIASTGDFEVSFTGAGLVMKSPNAARWRLTVSNAGVLGATAL